MPRSTDEQEKRKEHYTNLIVEIEREAAKTLKRVLLENDTTYSKWARQQIEAYVIEHGYNLNGTRRRLNPKTRSYK